MDTVLYDIGNGEFGRVYGRRCLFGRRTEHVDVLGTGIEGIPIVPKVRVSVLRLYGSYKSVVYRYWAGLVGYRGHTAPRWQGISTQ